MAKAVMLNPIHTRFSNLVRKYHGDMKRAAREWKQLKKGVSNPVRTGNPFRKKRGVSKMARVGLKAMPKEWQEKWKAGLKAAADRTRDGRMTPEWWSRWRAGLSRVLQPMAMPAEWKAHWKRGMKERAIPRLKPVFGSEFVRRLETGVEAYQPLYLEQPMAMPSQWKAAWHAGMEAARPTMREIMSPTMYEAWRKGVQAYQPLDLAGTMREVVSTETLGQVAAVATGIAAGALAPTAVTKITGKTLGTVGSAVASLGTGVVGYIALNAFGYSRFGLGFLAGSVGGMIADYVLSKVGGGAAAGLGQVPADVKAAVEKEVAKTLAEQGVSGLGATVEDIAELGQVYSDDIEELQEGLD
jgi:hypothetical protein